MKLMQKYIKTDGTVRMDDLRRWSFDSLIVIFLSETISATSVEKLIKISKKIQSFENIQSDAFSIYYLTVHEEIKIFKK
jgi:hypothetical protein